MASETENDPGTGFPIVGIGASAGGLAAFDDFFSGIPAGTKPGLALILVQHLAPDHESHLVELVRRQTDLEVFEVTDGMQVEKDRVYVIPPAKSMVLREGHMRLLEPAQPRGHRLPIDLFFRSLAEEMGERAICLVLSGTGSDGTLGVRAVKGRGGLVLAQDPDSTEYGGMPRNAIATGMVDDVLPANRLFARLADYAGHAALEPRATESAPSPSEEETLAEVFELLRGRSGHDFTQYKRNSVRRRIERRMAVQQVELLDDYARYLAKAPEEIDALFRDLLIGVTRFFRDPEAFLALEEKGIARLVEERASGSPIRVWVPGCSTGEEAYSIAILLHERMNAAGEPSKLQIFATDLDARAIEVARAGRYPASIADDVSPERLKRYFALDQDGETYRIRKGIRDLLVFSEHDLVTDPPFSRLDLISCRNVLIYMGPGLQKKLIPLFHYALSPGGLLFLGTSESVGEFDRIFETLDRSAKLFRRKEDLSSRPRRGPGPFPPGLPRASPVLGGARAPKGAGTPVGARWSAAELMERELLKHHAPAAALIDSAGEILYLHGRTGRFLEPAPGEGRMNILEMAREGLRRELAVSLHRAVTHKDPVHRGGLRIQSDGAPVIVDLTIRAVPTTSGEASATNLYLVVMDDGSTRSDSRPGETSLQPPPVGGVDGARERAGPAGASDPRIRRLEEELRAKEEYLQAIHEEMQSSNEELRSSNEELQSTNEELQSTNEEMETSKEELQSVNEELATINAELEAKVSDLSRAENDMKNLLASTGIGTVFVDLTLRIQRFTPSATEILNLIESDIGRRVGDLTSRLPSYDRLDEDIETVLETLVPLEVEVQTRSGGWYLLRIRPYRTLENVIEGAVITFTDVSELREARATLRETEALRRLAVVVEDANDVVTMQDLDGRIQAWNPAAVRVYGWTQAEALGMNYLELVPADRTDETRAMLGELRQGDAPAPFRTVRRSKDGRTVPVWVTATALVNESGSPYALATTERPVPPDAERSTGASS
jgi:two-component system, chemotaxis family, CheB/CheR fusion protein